MFKRFIDELVDNKSIKLVMSQEAKEQFANHSKVTLVHSLVFYRLYVLYAKGVDTDVDLESRSTFFRLVGTYLYYDKFPCTHGEEYYYYIKFNENSAFYQEHQHLIEQLILFNDPSTLQDYVGTRDLKGYNKYLKSTLQKETSLYD